MVDTSLKTLNVHIIKGTKPMHKHKFNNYSSIKYLVFTVTTKAMQYQIPILDLEEFYTLNQRIHPNGSTNKDSPR